MSSAYPHRVAVQVFFDGDAVLSASVEVAEVEDAEQIAREIAGGFGSGLLNRRLPRMTVGLPPDAFAESDDSGSTSTT